MVSLPITDNNSYDLVADKDGKLSKVQVKTVAKTNKYGTWTAQIGRVRPNKTKNVIHKFDPGEVDYLFIVLGDGRGYFIPSGAITTGRALTLSEQWGCYRITK